MKSVRRLLILITVFSLFSVLNVYAKKNQPPPPVATLISQWSPSEQLTSIVGDTRTVELQMNVQTDRQFWAMDISCLVSQAGLFEDAAIDQELTLSSAWIDGNDSVNHLVFVDNAGKYYDEGTNRINVVVTRVGASNQPVGLNGVSYNQLLFKLQLQVKENLTGVINVSLTCDEMTLLDRNGNSLGEIALTSNNLILRDGYTLQGKVARQGNENISDVEVTCQVFDIDGNTSGTTYTAGILYDFVYDKKGRIKDQFEAGFLFDSDTNGGQPLRELGLYKCEFVSKIDGTEETVYLKGTSYINLQTSSYTLQPVTLLGGDVNGDDVIDVSDFPLITGPWGTEDLDPYTGGDVNGDGVVNEVDLAIAAGNVGLSESDSGLMDHVIYSVARDYGGDFPNNSLSLGGIFAGNATQLNSDRAFWPQMSPDGSQLAYYTNTKTTVTVGKGKKATTEIVLTEGLVVADSNNYAGTVIAAGTNVAPSWSPSGNRIAYICTWDGGTDGLNGVLGYQYNNGNVCVIGANGGTPQVIDTYAEIFPPAWYDDTTLVYAGNSENTECPDRLCYYDMLTNTTGELTIAGVDGTPNANMPVIVRYGADATYLFYRTFESGVNVSALNMATVIYTSATDTWTGGIDLVLDSDDTHQSVDTITGLHYYDVSPLLDVMYYEFGDTQFHNVFFDANTVTWSAAQSHMVDGFIGYPMTLNDGTSLNVWDGFSEGAGFAPTFFHIFRPTVDWLP